ncbi:MAG TPA: hypothetical protein VJM31_00315 [Vicinamibacterales bacterium]|nr:hypothetical protein [Vicinamibacterales bacterium]
MIILLILLVLASSASAQDVAIRGFAEVQSAAYPETTPQDADRVAVEGRFRFEPAYKATSWLTLAGSADARIDNLELVERAWRFDIRDRGVRRPPFSLRHAAVTLRRGPVAVDLGKQFIRWGKADILNPTDRFAPRDFLEVTDDEFLAVTGARVQLERGGHSIDLAWVPLFTPSRIPLAGRRWAPVAPQILESVAIIDLGPAFPGRSQYGARWNARGSGYELSLSYFDGFNHLPHFTLQQVSEQSLALLQRSYAPLQMAGVDAAVPLRWFAIKGEAAWLKTTSAVADDLVLYVIQLERQSGELSLVGGYAGEHVAARRSALHFAPDRGLTRAFLGRVGYTFGPTSEMTFEAAVRQNLDGVWLKGQYSRALDAHWRWTLAGAAIGGEERDFIGQYRRNSHLLLTIRYSF